MGSFAASDCCCIVKVLSIDDVFDVGLLPLAVTIVLVPFVDGDDI